MNHFLHNIGDIDSDEVLISPDDSLIAASVHVLITRWLIHPLAKKAA
jgi:hypothetical protein